MKKISVAALVFLFIFTSLYAQDAGRFTFGARGGFQAGIGKTTDAFKTLENNLGDTLSGNKINVDEQAGVGGNLVLSAAYGFTNSIGLQTELNFMIGQGKELRHTSNNSNYIEFSYSTLDIPLLLKVNFLSTQSRFGVLGGPYFTLPLGQASITYNGAFNNSDEKTDISAPNFGYTFGLYGGFSLMGLRWVADIRYIQDFGTSTLKKWGAVGATNLGFMNRRGIVVSVGAEYTL